MCAVEFLGEFVVTPGQLLDLADQRPAQIFEFLAVAGLAYNLHICLLVNQMTKPLPYNGMIFG